MKYIDGYIMEKGNETIQKKLQELEEHQIKY